MGKAIPIQKCSYISFIHPWICMDSLLSARPCDGGRYWIRRKQTCSCLRNTGSLLWDKQQKEVLKKCAIADCDQGKPLGSCDSCRGAPPWMSMKLGGRAVQAGTSMCEGAECPAVWYIWEFHSGWSLVRAKHKMKLGRGWRWAWLGVFVLRWREAGKEFRLGCELISFLCGEDLSVYRGRQEGKWGRVLLLLGRDQ